MQSQVIVADTGPLIALAITGLLPKLPVLFHKVYVTDAVVAEATTDVHKPGAKQITQALQQQWLTVQNLKEDTFYNELTLVLDKGEAQTLAVAKQLNIIALVDEKIGRQVAKKHGISMTGTAALLIAAKKAGVIIQVRPILDLLTKHGYRLSDNLKSMVLHHCEE